MRAFWHIFHLPIRNPDTTSISLLTRVTHFLGSDSPLSLPLPNKHQLILSPPIGSWTALPCYCVTLVVVHRTSGSTRWSVLVRIARLTPESLQCQRDDGSEDHLHLRLFEASKQRHTFHWLEFKVECAAAQSHWRHCFGGTSQDHAGLFWLPSEPSAWICAPKYQLRCLCTSSHTHSSYYNWTLCFHRLQHPNSCELGPL